MADELTMAQKLTYMTLMMTLTYFDLNLSKARPHPRDVK